METNFFPYNNIPDEEDNFGESVTSKNNWFEKEFEDVCSKLSKKTDMFSTLTTFTNDYFVIIVERISLDKFSILIKILSSLTTPSSSSLFTTKNSHSKGKNSNTKSSKKNFVSGIRKHIPYSFISEVIDIIIGKANKVKNIRMTLYNEKENKSRGVLYSKVFYLDGLTNAFEYSLESLPTRIKIDFSPLEDYDDKGLKASESISTASSMPSLTSTLTSYEEKNIQYDKKEECSYDNDKEEYDNDDGLLYIDEDSDC